MDITTLRIIATVASFLAFVGVWIWAWLPRNAAGFAQAAQLPFEREQSEEAR